MVKINNVSKNYGKIQALINFSIEIEQAGIYCLLGRNGAGKSTLLKLIAGHINASAGSVEVNGAFANTLNMPPAVHFVASDAYHFNMKIEELFKAAEQVGEDFNKKLAMKLAQNFGLDTQRKYNKLSFGMRTMVNTILGLASGEEVLLLDEPVLGFDAIMRKKFYNLLQESQNEKERIVIVSTHLIDEIADIAERLIVIDKGSLVTYTDINEIFEKAYTVTGVKEVVEAAVKGLNVLSRQTVGGFLSATVFDERIKESAEYKIENAGLQDFFIGLVGGNEEA